ncbi:hypothetical protein [Shewanella woodyi]|uniref:hypothetical protein n=1 Tax=Shewanella woodyi TaxID=60961 RepID=UPI0007EAA887|nr:hypothetical protein [Shewanella woodyi]
MNEIWLVESDNDNKNVTLYAESLSFILANGRTIVAFEYDTSLDEEITKAELRVSEVEGDVFSPYLNVIGTKGMFINGELSRMVKGLDCINVIPLDIIFDNELIEGEWYFSNAYRVLDVIDWEASEVTKSSGGKVLFVDNLSLKESEEPYPDMFRVEGFLSVPLITKSLYEQLSKIVSPGYELIPIDEFER